VTELKSIDLGNSDVNGYEGEDGDYADSVKERQALQADDGSTQDLEE